MEVRIKERRVNAICIVTISFAYTVTEQSRLTKFGYPSVNVGTETKLFSQFPYSKSFDGRELGHTEAERQALEYITTMRQRIQDVWVEFKAIPDTFDNEVVYTL